MQETAKRRALRKQDRSKLARLVEKNGQVRTAQLLGISVQALASVAAGFHANNATVALVERRLAELQQGDHDD